MKVRNQGKVVAERQDMHDWLVMFPSGRVERFASISSIEKAAKRYFKRQVKTGEVGIGKIEWRT